MRNKHARQNFDNFFEVLSRQTFFISPLNFHARKKKVTPLIVDSCFSGSLFPVFQDQPTIVIAYAYVRRKENKGLRYRKFLEQLRTQFAEMFQYWWEIQDEEKHVFQLNMLKDVIGFQVNTWVTVKEQKRTTKYLPPLSLACKSAADLKDKKEGKIENERIQRELFSVRRKAVYSTCIGSSCVGSIRDPRKRTRICLRTPYSSCAIKSVVKTFCNA